MEQLALSVKELNKYFHEPQTFHVLKDISFEIKKGEFLALTGKSGSGKSTLLYILSTMDTAYGGTLTINGSKLTGKAQNELAAFRNEHIGFVFQFHYLLPEFSALDNVMLPALKLGKKPVGEIREKAMENLKLLEIENQAMKPANKLSGGQHEMKSVTPD